MFKCSSSYCIPWSYVCDSKWDCPEGDDEQCEGNSTCSEMFLSVNKLSSVMKNCFASLHKLGELMLNKNRITNVERGSFTNLTQLTFLNLSHNPLTHVSEKTFSNLLSLKLLSLHYVRFSTFERNTLKGIRLNVSDATDFRLCCIISAVRCEAEFPWYSSCDNLLPDYKAKLSFSFMSILILIVNLASVSLHFFGADQSNRGYTLAVISVNVSDILFGIYLLVIRVTESYYKDEFPLLDEAWRSSFVCFTAFCLILLFSISNQMFIAFLTLSRFMAVCLPMNAMFKNEDFTRRCIKFMWLLLSSLSLTITITAKLSCDILPTNLCLPFVDPTKLSTFIKILLLFIVSTMFITSAIVSILHISIVKFVILSKQKLAQWKSSRQSVVHLVLKMAILTSSVLVSWVFTGVVYIITLFKSEYSHDLVLWTVSAVLPVSSVVNPYLFLIGALKNYYKKVTNIKMSDKIN